jgi:hypothetical protein
MGDAYFLNNLSVYIAQPSNKGANTMAAQTTTHETNAGTPEQAKARRNAEYLAKIDRGVKELDDGKGISMSFAEWEEWIKKA